MSQSIAPITSRERIQIIDILRGFALCGIFFINAAAFAVPAQLFNIGADEMSVNTIVNTVLLVLVESKFFTLFSFLFGVGFAIQMMRAEAKQQPFVGRFLRRTAILALIGVIHITLIWEGDILLLYAVVALLLIPFRNASIRALRRWILGLFGLALAMAILALAAALIGRQIAPVELRVAEEQFVAELAATAETVTLLAQHESFGAYVLHRVTAYAVSAALYVTRVPTVLAMFLLGLLVGRQQILRNVEQHQSLLRRVCGWGLLLGTGVSILVTIANNTMPPLTAVATLFFNQNLSGPLQSMGMAAGIVLLARNAKWARLCKPLAAYGQMALTNYLAQSVLALIIFFGIGPVWQVNLAWVMLMVAVLLIVQIVFSNWWMHHFRFGPLEWVWRSLTYGSLQRIRRVP